MSTHPRTVLVTGATGRQGQYVVENLLSEPYRDRFRVFGLTRSIDQSVVEALESKGVRMLEGDLREPDALDRVFEMSDLVFGLVNFHLTDWDGFVSMSETIARLSAAHGVDHLVYSSLANCDRETGIPHFDATYEAEQRIRAHDVPTTFVRPCMFMQNFEFQVENVLSRGIVRLPVTEGTPLKLIDVDDIGLTTARAFADPDAFVGETIEICGDVRTLGGVAEALSDATGVDVDPDYVPVDDREEIETMYDNEMADDLIEMFEWFIEEGYDTEPDVAQDAVGTAFTDFEYYLRKNDWTDPEAKAG